MKGRPSRLLATLFAVAVLGIGGSGIALAANGSSNSTPPANSTQASEPANESAAEPADSATEPAESAAESEKGGAPESAADTAAQDKACAAAGITGDNVQFDDATGVCSLDTGSDNGK
jgi:cytoskeletal protein RodZ